ncbi:MAG: class I SAM-dependent methyltransferase [Acidimicrobiales bacterium]
MANVIANVDMAAAWDGDEGDDWATDWQRYDRAVAGYHRALLDHAAITRAAAVLDIGCGNGETTRAAARIAVEGSALGVDLSSRMLERARELTMAEGLPNARFAQADAQVHDFGSDRFDIVVSRFGAMFFADRQAAFTNIAGAMRQGCRLVMVAWQDVDNNEWISALRGALAVGRTLPSPPMGGPGPLGLADPDGVRVVLTNTGFGNVQIEPFDGPFWVGADADDAFAFTRRTGIVRGLLQGLDDADRARALAALQQVIIEHDTTEGVVFRSSVWLISADKR